MTPLVVRIEDLQTGTRTQFAFLRSPVRIGRSELNDLPLPQGFVSQWHAVVQFDEDEVRYVDLGSTNGSILDGARLAKNAVVVLPQGTQVAIGALLLTFERRATGEHRTVPPRTQFAIRAATVMRSAVRPEPRAAAGGEPAAAGPAAPHAGWPPSDAPLSAAPPDAAALAALAEALAEPLGEAPGAPTPEPLPELASAGVDQALDAASLDLDLLYASYRGSWEHLRAKLEETLAAMDPAARATAGRRLAEKYPDARREPQFLDLAGMPAPAAAPPRGGAREAAPPQRAAAHAAPGASDAEQLLSAFAESYLPASVQVRNAEQWQAFLGRAAEALEAFGRSFVEMRKGYEEFGKQMGVRTVHGDGPVQRAKDPRQLLAALLDPGQHGRSEELQAAFADYMVHQVALLNGVAEGAKAMLNGLSPESIEARTQGMWPMKGQALWKAYEDRFHALLEEEDGVSDALFGREFGRAYSAIAGQRGAEPPAAGAGEDGDEDDRPPPAKARRR
jgi:type VI secretion system protein ImpI